MKHPFSFAAFLMVFLLTAWLGLSQTALADPPKEIVLGYDIPKQTLTVTITHKSFFTGLHYVKQVVIRKNNEPIESKDYESQPGKETFAYAYKIPAAANDVLEVTAVCNIQGKKTATITVGGEKK